MNSSSYHCLGLVTVKKTLNKACNSYAHHEATYLLTAAIMCQHSSRQNSCYESPVADAANAEAYRIS